VTGPTLVRRLLAVRALTCLLARPCYLLSLPSYIDLLRPSLSFVTGFGVTDSLA
jgi:hypothetical protein